MSRLNLNKFLPARKAWRVFTRKVQTKLHKLHPSKTIGKPPKSNIFLRKTSKKSSCLPAFCSQRKRFKLKPKQTHCCQSYCFQKIPSAVYIDQLFIEPAVSTVKEYLQPPLRAAAASNQAYKKEICPSTSSAKDPEVAGSQETIGGMNKGKGKQLDEAMHSADDDMWMNKGKGKQLNEAMHSADDMWESLVLASPQMYGINERAEEFINKFRAEMLLQEKQARRL